MNTEHDANRRIQEELRKAQPKYYSLKVAEKYHAGISDFFIWGEGRCAALEVKLVKELPARATTLVLKHPFDGPQLTFMRSIVRTGNSAFGAVVTDYNCMVHLFSVDDIPESGNWEKGSFVHLLANNRHPSFHLADMVDLAKYVIYKAQS
jgi:hypothetical protein